jgi:nicotinamide mononucleotide transporter
MSDLLTQIWEGLKATGPFEWLAIVTGVVYIVLVMRHRRSGWIFGAISCLIQAVLFWRVQLPMQALLQLSYVAASVYGWRKWTQAGGARPIGVWHWRGHLVMVVVCVLSSLLLARLLAGESAFPFTDSLVFCVGMFATWLLARVYLENWAYWIVIDAMSVYLSYRQGLFAVALLYASYLGIATAGLVDWIRTRRGQLA